MKTASVLALAALALACRRDKPPPLSFGKLPRAALQDWAADCAAPIVEDPTMKGGVARGWRKSAFQRATHVFTCKPPGWSVYVDDQDTIVGLCVDDKHYVDSESNERVEEADLRASPLIAKHAGLAVASKATEESCDLRPHAATPELVRWKDALPFDQFWGGGVVPTTVSGSKYACCWEIVENAEESATQLRK